LLALRNLFAFSSCARIAIKRTEAAPMPFKKYIKDALAQCYASQVSALKLSARKIQFQSFGFSSCARIAII
jgi:hypothetical protein